MTDKRSVSDEQVLDTIAELMTGAEWDAELLGDIAELVRLTGREVADTDEGEDDERSTG
jgi:hypothetical protein